MFLPAPSVASKRSHFTLRGAKLTLHGEPSLGIAVTLTAEPSLKRSVPPARCSSSEGRS